MMADRPTAFVQVDIDGLWAVRRCYGRPERGTFEDDPCWTEGVVGLADLFQDLGIPASFFVVGRDMRVASKRRIARQLSASGFEIGNHSLNHRIGLTRLPDSRLRAEISLSKQAIERAGLPAPLGFRAPGYDVDARVRRMARETGHLYDASLLPSFLTWPLRVADAMLARRVDSAKRQFGRTRYGFARRHPTVTGEGLVQFPVGVLGRLGVPLTGSAIFAFGPRRVIPSIQEELRSNGGIMLLLHAVDMVDCGRPIVLDTRTPSTGGFNLASGEKREKLREVLCWLSDNTDIRRTDNEARGITGTG